MSIPFDQVERLEYAEIGGLVLATPAWECVDLSGLYDGPPVRGDDVLVPYHEGAIASRRIVGARRVVLPMVVYGDRDREGNVYDDARVGLRTNLDDLKREIGRPGQAGDGTKLFRHVFQDGEIRQAPCHVILPLSVGPLAPASVRCAIDLVIPGGVLRSPTLQEISKEFLGAGTLAVPNGGTADQFESIVTLTGSATSVELRNLTWDPSGETSLTYDASIAAGVVIDTGLWTAEAGGVAAIGNLEHGGHERWLPLAPGTNEIQVTPTGGTVTVKVEHYPAWL